MKQETENQGENVLTLETAVLLDVAQFCLKKTSDFHVTSDQERRR